MKVLWHNIKPVVVLFVVWRLFLGAIENVAPKLFSLRNSFIGPTPWANFDGVHYLTIAREGYYQYQQAFFPLYPLFIRWFSTITHVVPEIVALAISHASLLVGLVFFYLISKRYSSKGVFWSVVFFLLFPASFFFVAVYPESLYFMLAGAALYAIGKRSWWWAGILGLFASATRLFGVYLFVAALFAYFTSTKKKQLNNVIAISLIPFGLIGYMMYLWQTVGDPLAFFHMQPAFGANRSGDQLIFLPQVVWRYVKIFMTVSPNSFLFDVAVFEFMSFAFAILLLVKAWQMKLDRALFIYSSLVVITPTLTGTLSSFPRYLLAAFPLFFVVGKFSTKVKYLLVVIFAGSLVYFTSAFLRGYFVG